MLEDISCLYDDNEVASRIRQMTCHCFTEYARVFNALATETSNLEQANLYKAIYNVCMLSYSTNPDWPPYVPFFVPLNITPKLEIDDKDYKILSDVAEKVSDSKLRARMEDFLWCAERKDGYNKEFKHAQSALRAFIQLPITESGWFSDNQGQDCRRSLKLAMSLGRAASAELQALTSKMKQAYDAACSSGNPNNALRWEIPRLLSERDLNKLINPKKIADEFVRLISEVESLNPSDYYTLQAFASAAAEWYAVAGDTILSQKMQCLLASYYTAESDKESAKSEPNWFLIAHRCATSISLYSQMQKDYRQVNGLDKLCEAVKLKHDKAVCNGIQTLRSLRTPSIDISAIVQSAKEFVSGFDAETALTRLAKISTFSKNEIEETAAKLLQSSISAKICGASAVTPDGRIVASAPADSCRSDEVHKERLWFETVRYGAYFAQCECVSKIKPAIDTIVEEHKLTLLDFLKIVSKAKVIHRLHQRIYAQGLYLGYQGNFTAAAYILAPEIEQCIRTVLKSQSLVTTCFDQATKLQVEVGLSTLIKNHEQAIIKAFGEDFAFELRTIFSEHAGPNVRNEIAHGLKTDLDFNGSIDIYVWWFALRMLSAQSSIYKPSCGDSCAACAKKKDDR